MATSADRFLSLHEVRARTGLSRATIYRLQKAGAFPAAYQLGSRAVRWSERELEAWLASRPRGSRQAADAG